MHKPLIVLLCFSLAGIFLLSACNGTKVETQVAEAASPSSTIEKSLTLPSPTLKATSTKVIKSTPSPAVPTKTAKPTMTPTVTQTHTVEEIGAEIDLLLKGLVKDLENTETVQETEIP